MGRVCEAGACVGSTLRPRPPPNMASRLVSIVLPAQWVYHAPTPRAMGGLSPTRQSYALEASRGRYSGIIHPRPDLPLPQQAPPSNVFLTLPSQRRPVKSRWGVLAVAKVPREAALPVAPAQTRLHDLAAFTAQRGRGILAPAGAELGARGVGHASSRPSADGIVADTRMHEER